MRRKVHFGSGTEKVCIKIYPNVSEKSVALSEQVGEEVGVPGALEDFCRVCWFTEH